MRFIFFFLITFIISSCGHQKIRFSRVKQTQKIVEISEIPSVKKETETALIPQTEFEETQLESTSSFVETSELDQSVEEIIMPEFENGEVSFPRTDEDSTTLTKEEVEYIKDEAIRAEKLGAWSLASSIASPVIFILATILFVIAVFGGGGLLSAVVAGVLGVSMLVFLVLSYVFGVSSLRAQYNTSRGRKFAIAGLTISSVLLGLFLINLLFSVF